MIRKRITASFLWLTLCAALTVLPALPAMAERLVVHNTTPVHAWITLYTDAGPLGWQIRRRPGYAEPDQTFFYVRDSDPNGPYRLRFEADYDGKHYDHETKFWYDGSQHRYNNPGDPDSVFYICSNHDGFFWSFSPKCDHNDNSR